MSPKLKPTNLKDDLFAAVLEFIGTTFFLFFALGGVQAATAGAALSSIGTSQVEKVFYIATCFGLSLLVSAWLFFRITGGLFNPEVSLALVLIGAITPVRFILYVIAQLAGGIAASAILLGITGELSSNNTLSPGVTLAQGFFLELIITMALILSVFMLAVEKHMATPFAPVGIGLTLLVGHMVAIPFDGCSMNSARSFGPAVISGFPSEHWIYWAGPIAGCLFGVAFYAVIKHNEYWRLNPDQAATEQAKTPQLPRFYRSMSALGTINSRTEDRPARPGPGVARGNSFMARMEQVNEVNGPERV